MINEEILKSLRREYLHLVGDMNEALFGVVTLPLDDREKELLSTQVTKMSEYAQILLLRAEYLAQKQDKKFSCYETSN